MYMDELVFIYNIPVVGGGGGCKTQMFLNGKKLKIAQ
jgi:hypothetical protein